MCHGLVKFWGFEWSLELDVIRLYYIGFKEIYIRVFWIYLKVKYYFDTYEGDSKTKISYISYTVMHLWPINIIYIYILLFKYCTVDIFL